MFNWVLVLAFIAAIFMGMAIGATPVSSAFGPVISAGSAGVLKAALLGGLAAFLGAVVQGDRVSATIGENMIDGGIVAEQAFVILLVASTLVIISALTKYPMPTAFTIVGSVIGSAFSFGDGIRWGTIQLIVGYWALVPILAIAIGFGLAWLLRTFLPKEESKKPVQYLTLFMGLFVAYTAGANSVGKAVGPLVPFGIEMSILLGIGGISILAGTWILSPKIIDAVSFEYSSMGPRRSVSALGTAAILAQIGVFLGVPISFAQAIIASTIGCGLVAGASEVGGKKTGFTIIAWISAFFIAIVFSFGLGYLVQLII